MIESIEGDTLHVRVMFEDTDCTGRVHFSRYTIWLDNGIVNYFRRRGFAYEVNGIMKSSSPRTEVAFAVGEYHARIERPSKLGDLLEVTVKPSEIRRKVVVFEGRMRDAEDGTWLAHGSVTLVHIDPTTGKSKDMPGWLIERLKMDNP